MAFKYLPKELHLLPYAHAALEDWFTTRDEFDKWYLALASDERREVVLRVAPAYLALVKRGDWHVEMEGSNPIVEYFTDTYKCIGLISLIESLTDSHYLDFYQFMVRKSTNTQFPLLRITLDQLYEQYKAEFGATRACVEFFQLLPEAKQAEMAKKIKIVSGGKASTLDLEKVVRHLYQIRSNFAHRGVFSHGLAQKPTFTKVGGKSALVELSIKDLMAYFEEAFLIWCVRS